MTDSQRAPDPYLGIKEFIAGANSGIACKIVEYPMDTVKVLLQRHGTGPTSPYSSTIDCLRKVLGGLGVRGLYKGMATPLAASMLENAVLFTTYGIGSRIVKETMPAYSGTLLEYTVAGAVAGVGVAAVLTPAELVKCRLQIDQDKGTARYRGPVHCITEILKEGGIRGMYRGTAATLLRECPGNGAWFGVYFSACKAMTPVGKTKDDLAPWQNMLAGSMAGMCYWTAFYPADVIKTQVQTQPELAGKSFLSVMATLLKSDGIRGIYRGWTVTMLRAIPSNAMLFLAYETSIKLMRRD